MVDSLRQMVDSPGELADSPGQLVDSPGQLIDSPGAANGLSVSNHARLCVAIKKFHALAYKLGF